MRRTNNAGLFRRQSRSASSDHAIRHHPNRSNRPSSRCDLKLVFFAMCLLIGVIYRLTANMLISYHIPDFETNPNTERNKARTFNMIDDSVVLAKHKAKVSKRKGGAVAIIASAPDSKERLVALWSQLECFYANDKYDEIIISAPDWAKEENIIEPFLQKAVAYIPHLKNASVILQYHLNDRYDVGLWCDALLSHTVNVESVQAMHNEFVLSNDSIMAVEDKFTAVLDYLHDKNLSMTSLNFSLLDGYWLESAMRAFSKKGVGTYIQRACVPASHEYWCPGLNTTNTTEATLQKRCIVENFEISIARLFPRHETWGLFPSDVPEDMIKDELLMDGKTW